LDISGRGGDAEERAQTASRASASSISALREQSLRFGNLVDGSQTGLVARGCLFGGDARS
jgi:hypothetical protein